MFRRASLDAVVRTARRGSGPRRGSGGSVWVGPRGGAAMPLPLLHPTSHMQRPTRVTGGLATYAAPVTADSNAEAATDNAPSLDYSAVVMRCTAAVSETLTAFMPLAGFDPSGAQRRLATAAALHTGLATVNAALQVYCIPATMRAIAAGSYDEEAETAVHKILFAELERAVADARWTQCVRGDVVDCSVPEAQLAAMTGAEVAAHCGMAAAVSEMRQTFDNLLHPPTQEERLDAVNVANGVA